MSVSPHHVTNAAIKGHAVEIATRLGINKSLVWAMGEGPEKDRYSRLIQFWLILADLDFAQADLIFRDFEARRNAKCPTRKGRRKKEQDVLGDLSEAVSDLMKTYFSELADHEKFAAVAKVEEVCRQLSSAILSRSERAMLQEQRP
jgi:hypothetical protein